MPRIVIDGRVFDGSDLSIINGVVTVDGVTVQDGTVTGVVEIRVEGTLASLTTDANVVCKGVTGSVKAGGNVACGDVGGDVRAGGNIVANTVLHTRAAAGTNFVDRRRGR